MCDTLTGRAPRLLPEAQWVALAAAHRARVAALVAGHRERAGRGAPHPVEDFLFSYYSYRPAALRRWHPGAGIALAGESARERLGWRGYVAMAADDVLAVGVDAEAFVARRGPAVRAVRDLLVATAARPAQLGCLGLHEWAMAFRAGQGGIRHADWPLRLGGSGTDAVVTGHRIRCTHHDAFRFFTAPARPLNAWQPTRQDQLALEQPGCLHATMDLYKWAYKLAPATPSALVLACFELAREVREVDMRASPYDLRALGYEPIAIETAHGKAQYVDAQRAFAERAAPLRSALVAVCDGLLAARPPAARPTGPRAAAVSAG